MAMDCGVGEALRCLPAYNDLCVYVCAVCVCLLKCVCDILILTFVF